MMSQLFRYSSAQRLVGPLVLANFAVPLSHASIPPGSFHQCLILTTSESLLTCWNISEAKTIPDIRTVGSAMLLCDVTTIQSGSPQRVGNAGLRFSSAARLFDANLRKVRLNISEQNFRVCDGIRTLLLSLVVGVAIISCLLSPELMWIYLFTRTSQVNINAVIFLSRESVCSSRERFNYWIIFFNKMFFKWLFIKYLVT